METYGKILLIAMPVFLLLVLAEKFYGWRMRKDTVQNMDMISSLTSGVTNVTKDVLGLSLTILGYSWFVQHVTIFHVPLGWLTYLIAFIALDFAGYWVHRWSHHINLFWNLHIIHHSSEEFNLACALRQSISNFVNVFAFLLLPAAIFGVPVEVIAVVAPLHLFAQFWYHTQHIGKMGILEKIIVTPSHHRVHHAINREYLDKNFGQIFIIWDKFFGSFQEELKEVPPAFGITRPVMTWNPIRINFQHLWLMITDTWRTRNWKDKFTLWFNPTGYRPEDMMQRYPSFKIEDVYGFQKYAPHSSNGLKIWSWVQLIMLLLFVSYLFGNIAPINKTNPYYIYWYGLFIFLSVYAMTELMDRSKQALIWEVLRSCTGMTFLIQQSDWFGTNNYSIYIRFMLAGYFLCSIVMTAWLSYEQRQEDRFTQANLQ